MKQQIFLFHLCFVVFIGAGAYAANADAGMDILQRALAWSAAIQDYSAQIVVTMDLPGLQIPRRTATVYYKQPDKIAIKSRGVVIIPRRALIPGYLGAQITQETRVKLLQQQRRAGSLLYTLKVTPAESGAAGEYVLLNVRGDRFTIERLDLFHRGRKQLSIEWRYQLVEKRFWLPQHIRAHIIMPTPPVPPRAEREKSAANRPSPKAKQEGLVTVAFYNIRVNAGLSDSLFQEQK